MSKGLNVQQVEVVEFDHSRGGVLVLAGAGSGKTTVLTRRIALLFQVNSKLSFGNYPFSGILALTFTKYAALEMKSRLRSLLVTNIVKQDFPWIGTFHSFAFGLIRESFFGVPNWHRLGFTQSPKLMDSEKRREWLVGIHHELGQDLSLDILEKWLTETRNRNEDPNPSFGMESRSEAQKILLKKYRIYQLETGCVDFDNMVELALQLLRQYPDVLVDLQRRTRHILVDEFQDTSRDQLELVQIILGKSHNLFLVGDDDQAIYGFRGADPGNIQIAFDYFPQLQILKLETNYRSTVPIVAFANRVFREKPKALRKLLVAVKRPKQSRKPTPVRKIIHSKGADQAIWMADEIRRLCRDEGLAFSDIAILYRLNVFEAYYKSFLTRLVSKEAADEIVLNTIHGAKGLEYPAVFFVGLEDGVLPFHRRGERVSPERLAEEKRIFYVGITRAQRFLYLCASRSRVIRGKRIEADISEFLIGRIFGALRRLRNRR